MLSWNFLFAEFLQTSVVSIHCEAWVSSIETVKSGLQATLIIKCLGLDDWSNILGMFLVFSEFRDSLVMWFPQSFESSLLACDIMFGLTVRCTDRQ